MDSVSLTGAFLGGLLSFLSPCVLPLVPAYLSFLTGLSGSELGEHDRGLAHIMIPSLLFTLGFTLVFVLIGAAAGFASQTLGPALGRYHTTLRYLAGIAIVLIGVFMLGVIKIPGLYGEARFDLSRASKFGRGAAFVMGLAFGFGWTPCVGPILTVILGLAARTGDTWRAAGLLGVYSAGLAFPFLLTALFFGKLQVMLRWFSQHSLLISRTAGVILVLMGLLIMSGQLGRLSGLLIEVIPALRVLG